MIIAAKESSSSMILIRRWILRLYQIHAIITARLAGVQTVKPIVVHLRQTLIASQASVAQYAAQMTIALTQTQTP